jgi:hypothetical protein
MCIKGKSSVYCSELCTMMAARCLIEERTETTAPLVMNAIICLVTLQSQFNILRWTLFKCFVVNICKLFFGQFMMAIDMYMSYRPLISYDLGHRTEFVTSRRHVWERGLWGG